MMKNDVVRWLNPQHYLFESTTIRILYMCKKGLVSTIFYLVGEHVFASKTASLREICRSPRENRNGDSEKNDSDMVSTKN